MATGFKNVVTATPVRRRQTNGIHYHWMNYELA